MTHLGSDQPARPPIEERATADHADPASADDRVGESIGPYRLLSRIGEGGMGVVYLAEQTAPVRRRLALKLIKLGMDTREVVARFEAERQALALMNHPCIARVFDAGAAGDGRPYFAMEHVKGEPITTFCDKHKLSTDARLELFLRVCDAVQHAHAKGVIHRDIKPSNVLVAYEDGKPIPKVIDFGVAKAMDQPLTKRTLATRMGQMVGTPEYMSPEQAEMSGQDVDTRTDVYSLGVLLYELLVGVLPLDFSTASTTGAADVKRLLREVEPPSPSVRLTRLKGDSSVQAAVNRRSNVSALAREVRGDLDWIAMKAMEKDRTRRYATSAELAADIRRHLANEPVIARPPSAVYRAKKFVRRHRAGVSLAAAVLAALLVGFAFTAWQAVRAMRAEQLALQRLEEVEAQSARAQAISGFLNDMITSVDPEQGRGADVTVASMLDEWAAKVDDAFPEQPSVRSDIHTTLAKAYFRLGRFDDAAKHVEAGLAIAEQGELENPLAPLELSGLLGIIRLGQGQLAEAERLQREALQGLREAAGENDERAVSVLYNLAWTLMQRGKLNDAEPLLREALSRTDGTVGASNPEQQRNHVALADLLMRQGRTEEAERVSAEALESTRATLGEMHVLTAYAMEIRAWVLQTLGRLEESKALRQAALEIHVELQGQDHVQTLRSKGFLAWLLFEMGQASEALPIAKSAYESLAQQFGDDNPATLNAANTYAVALGGAGEAEAAARLHEQILESRRQTLGEKHPNTIGSMNNLASAYWRLNRLGDALRLYEQAWQANRDTLGPAHPETLMARANIGFALWNQGQLEQAERVLREALAVQEKTLGLESPSTLNSMVNLGGALGDAGKYDEAVAVLEKARAPAQRVYAPGADPLLQLLGNLANSLLEAGRLEDAQRIARAALRDAPPIGAAQSSHVARLHRYLGEALLRLGEYEQARKPLIAAHGWFAAREWSAEFAREIASLVAECFEAEGDPDAAATWRQRAAQPIDSANEPAGQ